MTGGAGTLTGLRLLLLDMDGTVYLGERRLPGARALLEASRERGIQVVFATNNSSKDPADYEAKLNRLGLPVSPGAVVTSGTLACRELAGRAPRPRVQALGTEPLLRQCRDAGLDLLDPEQVEAPPDVLLLGFDMTLTYGRLRAASHWLLRGVEYVATHPDLVCPTEDGPIPDTGSFIALLEAATGRRPDCIVGKPSPEMVRIVLESRGVTTAEAAFVGDRLYTDMRMARAAGVRGILVLSGETKAGDLTSCPESDRPDVVVDGVGDLVALLPDRPRP